jgi:hypothetical protein
LSSFGYDAIYIGSTRVKIAPELTSASPINKAETVSV